MKNKIVLFVLMIIPASILFAGNIPQPDFEVFWPTDRGSNHQITSGFNEPRVNHENKIHGSTDIDGIITDPVYSLGDGIVEEVVNDLDNDEDKSTVYTNPNYAGVNDAKKRAQGNYIDINHGGGWKSSYRHLKYNSILPSRDSEVVGGAQIAEMGNTGSVYSEHGDGSHLDIHVTHNGEEVDLEKIFSNRDKNKDECDGKDEIWKKILGIIGVAHDPNIMYGPDGSISAGQTLTYTVEFENEGEGIAYGVYVADILDTDIDDSSVIVSNCKRINYLTSSETAATFEYEYDDDTRLLTVYMDNEGEVGSRQGGKFDITVSAKGSMASGASITNYATVYFPSVPEETRTNSIVSVVPNQTQLVYSGDTTVPQHETAIFKATLTKLDSAELANQVIVFTINNTSYTAITNSSGTATVYPEIHLDQNIFNISVEYAGDGYYYLPSNTSASLDVTSPIPFPEISGASAVLATDASVTWVWNSTDAAVVSGYRIFSKADNTLLQELDKATTSWLESGLTPNTKYQRYIKPYNDYGQGTAAQMEAVTPAQAPANFKTSTDGRHCVVLSWDKSAAAGYKIKRTMDGSTWSAVADLEQDVNTYCNSGLSLATTYQYSICAYNISGIDTGNVYATAGTQPLPAGITLIHANTSGQQEQKADNLSFGEVKVLLPEGAVPCDGYIIIDANAKNSAAPAMRAKLVVGADKLKLKNKILMEDSIVDLKYYDIGGSTVSVFNKPMTLTLAYPDTDNNEIIDNTAPPVRAEGLRILNFDEASQEWVQVSPEYALDKAAKTVSVQINHFSMFALVSVIAPSSDLDNVKVFPNPYKPGSGGEFDRTSYGAGIVFKDLTAKADINIFNIAGELVAEFSEADGDGLVVWNAQNNSGEKVASGVYIYYIVNPDNRAQKKIGKIAIIK